MDDSTVMHKILVCINAYNNELVHGKDFKVFYSNNFLQIFSLPICEFKLRFQVALIKTLIENNVVDSKVSSAFIETDVLPAKEGDHIYKSFFNTYGI